MHRIPHCAVHVLALASLGSHAAGQAVQVLPGDLAREVSSGNQLRPALARGANGWLAVWEDDRASRGGFVQAPDGGAHPNRDVYAVRLDGSGAPIDLAPIVVNQAAMDQLTPRVAWNGSQWLVVWKSQRPTQFYVTTGIYAARVAADGTVIDTTPIVIEDGDDFDEREPVVASDGVNWLVVWTDDTGSGAETMDGAIVSPAGVVVQKQTMISGAQFTYPVNVDVEWAVDRYLVAYEKSFSGAYGRLFDGALAPIGGEITFQANANQPEVATNGSDFLVTFSGARGTPVSRAGVVAMPGGASYVGSGSAYGPQTDCAWDGTNWVVAFAALGIGSIDTMYLSHVTPSGALVAGSPVAVAVSTDVREFAVAPGPDRAQVAWVDASVSSVTFAPVDSGDVHGAQVLATGVAAQRQPITASAATQTTPVVAGSATAGWLVGFLRETSGVTQVCAQRVAPTGAPIDARPIVLATGDRRIRRMDVAFDGARWLVVWDDTNASNLRHTFGRRVALDGSLPDPAPIDYLRGERPSVGADEQGKFLIASWDHNQSNESIRAQRVSGVDGAALDAPYLTLGSGSGFPDVLGFDDRWIVAWGGVRAGFVLDGGALLPPFYFAAGASEAVHGLARSGDLGLLAFVYGPGSGLATNTIHVRRFRKDGTLLDSDAGIPLCEPDRRMLDPRAAFDGTDFRVTWTDYRAHVAIEKGVGDLYQAIVGVDGSVQSPCGVAFASDPLLAEGDAEIVADAGIVLVAANVLHPESPLGGLRVELHAETGSFGGEPICFGDGSSRACPCGNPSAIGAQAGCLNSLALGATLRAEGWASLTADSLVLHGAQMTNSSVLYFQGTGFAGGGSAGVAFGDGVRCVGGSVVRLATRVNTGGASLYPVGADQPISQRGLVAAPGVRHYQAWYRNAASFCTSSTFNLSNAVTVTWGA